jgi:hypothetical protein
MAYVQRNGKIYYKAQNGKLYASYQAALADQGVQENPYTASGFSPTPGKQLEKIGRDISGALGSVSRFLFTPPGEPGGPNPLGPGRSENVGSNQYSGIIGSIPPSANGESYRRAELRLADAARAGGGGGGGGNAGYSFGISGADIGGDGRGEQYRQQLSQYTPKVFPMTAEGQQERYFGTPEFNYVFGSQTGKGPKTAEEMRTLAAQTKAPVETPLSDYYRAQSAMGRVNQADIQAMYADRPDLQKWAAANPMLAQREFAKFQAKQEATPAQLPEGAAEFGARASSEGGYAGTFRENPGLFQGVANPVPPTQQPGPGGIDQGTRVSLSRGAQNIAPQQAAFTSGDSMPQFKTTLGEAKAFLETMKNQRRGTLF